MPNPFNRIARGEAYPGTCLRCKRDADLVDLGAGEIPNYGVVYLCWVCTGELFDTFNVVPRSFVDRAVTEANQKIGELESRLEDEAARDLTARLERRNIAHVAATLDSARADLLDLLERSADPDALDARAVEAVSLGRGGEGGALDLGKLGADAGAAAGDDSDGVEDAGRDGGVAGEGDVWDALSAPVPDEADQ